MNLTLLPMATSTFKPEYCDSLVYFLVFCREMDPWQSFSEPDFDIHVKDKSAMLC